VEERILSIEEAAAIVKLSERQLYRVAREGGGPFRKLQNRWRCYESELHAWFRSHEPRERDSASRDPMPHPSRARRGGSFRAQVYELDARRKVA
jgi:excisionase family DNA binding protein